MGKRKKVNEVGKVEGRELTEAEQLMPKKKFYRQRAHCNPLNDSTVDIPKSPNEVDWQTHFPAFFSKAYKGEIVPKVTIADIGCGFGGMTIALSKMFPEKLILGMEIREKVTEYVERKISALRIDSEPNDETPEHLAPYQNVSVVRANTMKYLCNFFAKGQLEKMLFLFPDPHFKASNHRRRIINTQLLTEYAFFLRPGGLLYTITDVQEVGEWMRSKITAHPLFEQVPKSEFESDPVVAVLHTATEEGQKVARNRGNTWRGCYRRRETASCKGSQ